MKIQQSIMLVAALLAASHLQAQEQAATAPQPTLTFPPQAVVSSNQVQYPGVGQAGPQFPTQAYIQQPQAAYPYTYYGNTAYPGYASTYYPYGQQQAYSPYYAQQQAYRPYGYAQQQAYNPYYGQQQAYNPYMAQQRMTQPYPLRPPVSSAPKKKETKPWGDTRYIWPDFYTNFTGDVWDKMINSPYDMGRMPGGWQFPSFSSPDPVTVGDAIANQVPPFAEESGNMVPLDDVGTMVPF